MRRDLNYGNQPANIIVRTQNKILIKPEPVKYESLKRSVASQKLQNGHNKPSVAGQNGQNGASAGSSIVKDEPDDVTIITEDQFHDESTHTKVR